MSIGVKKTADSYSYVFYGGDWGNRVRFEAPTNGSNYCQFAGMTNDYWSLGMNAAAADAQYTIFWDSTAQKLHVYVDNALIVDYDLPSTANIQWGGDLYIGGSNETTPNAEMDVSKFVIGTHSYDLTAGALSSTIMDEFSGDDHNGMPNRLYEIVGGVDAWNTSDMYGTVTARP